MRLKLVLAAVAAITAAPAAAQNVDTANNAAATTPVPVDNVTVDANAALAADNLAAPVTTTETTTTTTEAPAPARDDDGIPWGLVGLVGLVGLLGRRRSD